MPASTPPVTAAELRGRQGALAERYRLSPEEATMVARAGAIGGAAHDPFHGTVRVGGLDGDLLPYGVDPAVGGDGDLAGPGDLLCAALAACLDATIRLTARRLGVEVRHLDVEVVGEIDVRGALRSARGVPVGFRRLEARVDLRPGTAADERLVRVLVAAAERSCIVLQSLRDGVEVHTELAPVGAVREGARPAPERTAGRDRDREEGAS